jgi:phosphoribosylglycinamide formyltransferase-1
MGETEKLKLGVLVSGNGSNLQSIIDSCSKNKINAEVSCVISDNKEAFAIERARSAGIPALVILRKDFANKRDFEEAIVNALKSNGVQLVCLAGFMRIVGNTLLASFQEKVINIHPALLPSFPGLEAQKQAYDYGVKVAGCTVHFVDEKVDHGPIIAQSSLQVLEGETLEELKKRILSLEHEIYPRCIGLIADGQVSIQSRRVYISQKKS